jgi:hypothetical protein
VVRARAALTGSAREIVSEPARFCHPRLVSRDARRGTVRPMAPGRQQPGAARRERRADPVGAPHRARLPLAGTALVVEADGAAWHEHRPAREDDAQRQALLERHGERVLRVTWVQAVGRPDQTLARIRAAGAPPADAA